MHEPTQHPAEAWRRRADAVSGLVSVIIPAFDAAAWLAGTLASVHAQSYPAIEVIVVDDGSSDGTAVIAKRSGARVERTDRLGPGGARNAGMAVARGEFIQFLDADDLLASGKIARQVSVLESTGADVAWEPYHELIPVGPHSGEFTPGARIEPAVGPDVAAALLTARGFVQLGALLVRRTARTDDVWFEAGSDSVEDVRYAVCLATRGARFTSSDTAEPGLLYRQHGGPRYSTRPRLAFARACAANAAWAHAEWTREGTLAPARREALGEAYAFAARQLAAIDPPAFAAITARALSLGAAFTRHLPPRIRWLSRLVGYERAEAIATRWRRARAAVGRAGGRRPSRV